MNDEKIQKLSKAALAASLFPLVTLIPVLLHINLSGGIMMAWSGINMIAVVAGFVLSYLGVRDRDTRNMTNLIAMCVSSCWVLLILGIIAIGIVSNL